jgi:hypothetical protein
MGLSPSLRRFWDRLYDERLTGPRILEKHAAGHNRENFLATSENFFTSGKSSENFGRRPTEIFGAMATLE